MKARIYKPSKSAMQSARGKAQDWVLEYESPSKRGPEPLMGWTCSGDTLNQVKLFFDTREQAVAFAEKNGLTYSISKVRERRVKPRNYGDNFKYIQPVEDSA